MNKLYKYCFYSLIPLLAMAMVLGCSEDNSDKLTGDPPSDHSVDVSSRVSSLSSNTAGAGSNLTVTGTSLGGVYKVFIGQANGLDLEVSETQVSFRVAGNVTLGDQDLTLLFPNGEKAVAKLEIVPNPLISYFTPRAAADGTEVTIQGNNLSYVSSLNIGGTAATISSQDNGVITFNVPSGAPTGKINVVTADGSEFSSANDFVACTSEANNLLCLPIINTNGSFEEGALGEGATVPGWGLGSSFATYEITEEEAYDGFQSAKITVTGISTDAWRIQPNTSMPVDPTKTYHLSFWVKGTGFANIKFAIDGGGNPGYTEYGNPEISVTDNVWTEISYDFSPADEANGTDNMARFAPSMSYEGNLGGVIYFDNLRVTEVQ